MQQSENEGDGVFGPSSEEMEKMASIHAFVDGLRDDEAVAVADAKAAVRRHGADQGIDRD